MTLSPPQARDLKELGYFVVRDAVPRDLVDTLTEALRAVEGRGTRELSGSAVASWTPVLDEYRIYNFPECADSFRRLVVAPEILGPIRSMMPGPIHLTEAFTTTRRRGPGVPLHRVPFANFRIDRERACTDHAKVMLFLTDCGPDDGPPVVIAGSHRRDRELPRFGKIHPGWDLPPWDADYVTQLRSQFDDADVDTPWEEIPGYAELCVNAGDIVFFTEDLWHGAKWLASDHTRRALHLGYSPYHIAKWHGLAYSDDILRRATPEERALLEGPFIGHRLADGDRELALADRFPALPHSERRGVAAAGDGEGADPEQLMEIVAERLQNGAGESPGVCALHLTGPRGGRWLVDTANGAKPRREEGLDSASSVIEIGVADFEALLSGSADPVALFNCGALRVRGDVSLAMRVTDRLLAH